MDGPVGGMVRAQARHGMRPAHIHFLVGAPGYRELVTALYLRDDPHLADDVVFGSSDDLAVDIDPNDPGCPIKGLPSIRFDMRLSREGAADKVSGRVGADPAAILKPAGSGEQSPWRRLDRCPASVTAQVIGARTLTAAGPVSATYCGL